MSEPSYKDVTEQYDSYEDLASRERSYSDLQSIPASKPPVGAEGGLDWILAGELGALMGTSDQALLVTLQAFGVSLGHTEAEALMAAERWLPLYRGFLKASGVANCG